MMIVLLRVLDERAGWWVGAGMVSRGWGHQQTTVNNAGNSHHRMRTCCWAG